MIPVGKCCICYNDRIRIKPGHYACPGYYGSPMHWCCWVVFEMRDGMSKEAAKEKAREKLEAYCGCTLEEYLEARERDMALRRREHDALS